MELRIGLNRAEQKPDSSPPGTLAKSTNNGADEESFLNSKNAIPLSQLTKQHNKYGYPVLRT
jgi:hypothetical protein